MHKESNPRPRKKVASTLLTKPFWICVIYDSKRSNYFTRIYVRVRICTHKIAPETSQLCSKYSTH